MISPLLPQTWLVYLAGREADIVELMLRDRELQTPLDWLVRSRQN